MMMQTILAGVDWGETVDAVSNAAVDLAMSLDATLQAVYVEDTRLIEATERANLAALPLSGRIPLEAPNMAELESEFQSEERSLGRRFLRLIADTRIRGGFLVERGEVHKILIRESRARDLLVMGKYSERVPEDRSDLPIGGNVRTVIRRAFCPVVLVPPGAALGPRHLAVYDGSAVAYRALAAAVRIGRAIGAELRVLVVGKPERSEELLGEARAYLEAHRTSATYVRRPGEPIEEIPREAEGWQADLLVLGIYGSGRRKGSFREWETDEILVSLDRAALVCGPMEGA